MLELQKKIQELEISLQEAKAKAKQAVPPSGIKSPGAERQRQIDICSYFSLEQDVFLKRILLSHRLSLLKF
jgi:hypothetical protein